MPEVFPLIVVEGTPIDRGLQHGSQAADRVARSVEIHRQSIAYYTGLPWSEAVERAGAYLGALETYAPDMLAELRGIAEGARLPFPDILALNVRAELTFNAAMVQGCTSFAVLPEASSDGNTYLGQSWDNLWALTKSCIVLRAKRSDGPDYLTVTEAGAPAMVGFNANGIGVVRNAMVAAIDPVPNGVPMNAVHYRILAAADFGQAITAVVDAHLATPWFYMIAAPGEVLGFEVAPPRLDHLHDSGGLLVHANHFVGTRLDVVDLGPRALPDSLFRDQRLRRCLEARRGQIDAADVLAGLRDHFNYPCSLCRHVDERVPADGQMATVFVTVMNLDERVMTLTEGPSCCNPQRTVSLT